VPFPDDLARYRATIAAAREQADFVIVANHWGYSSWVEALQDYELELARDAIDHGADAVVCHHHHSLRGIEIRAGRPIYYGLGALIHHFSGMHVSREERAARHARFGDRSSWIEDEIFPLWPFRAVSRMTGAAVLDLRADGVLEAGFIPAQMLEDGSTEPLRVDDPRAVEVADYVERLTRQSGFDTAFERSERDGWLLLRARTA
jgi:capsule synthesis protein PGA_cap